MAKSNRLEVELDFKVSKKQVKAVKQLASCMCDAEYPCHECSIALKHLGHEYPNKDGRS